MKKYAKLYSESLDGCIGKCYFEVIDYFVTRQIDVFGEDYYWSDSAGCNKEGYEFTDQPEWDENDESSWDEYEEISVNEFEEVWRTAKSIKY